MAAASASFSATHTISVPGSTLLEFGTVRLAPTGIVIPRDMWVRVRVTGSIRIDADPEWVRRFCNPGPPSECPPPYDGASAGPLGVDQGLEVQVAMNNAYFLWRPRASGGDGAEDIMWVSAGTGVLAGRAGLWEFGDCWGCTHQPGRAGRYRLTGTQTLTVEEINPLSVRADRTETDPAEPVGFTARADEEMRNLEWAFVAGDTFPESGPAASRAPAGGATFSTSAAAAPAADWNALASCRRKEACTTRIAASGRMWVRGHIEDQIVFARSEIVRVQPVRLKLDCTPNPVTRGQSITCTASKDPASAPGEVKITGWSFAGAGSTIKAEEEDQHSPTWGGTMVVSGTISVVGTIGGRAVEPATVAVNVIGRNWTGKIKYPDATSEFVGEPDLPYPPVTPENPELEDGVLGVYLDAPPVASYGEGSGPNKGWVYVDEPPLFSMTPLIRLNVALRPDNPFYRAQRGDSGVRLSGRPACGPAFMRQAARHVPAHEDGHHQVAKSHYESSTTAETLEQTTLYEPNSTSPGRSCSTSSSNRSGAD
jgi:hypothetical protein